MWLNEAFSVVRVDSSCFKEFCASVIRGVSHLYWKRVYFGGDEVVVVCGRFILDCGINAVWSVLTGGVE